MTSLNYSSSVWLAGSSTLVMICMAATDPLLRPGGLRRTRPIALVLRSPHFERPLMSVSMTGSASRSRRLRVESSRWQSTMTRQIRRDHGA